ncbi:stringent starvation protein B [Chiayiivirga flava]|uniref:Stringent starvation protein B n=2 Tax=Chiayiivirga flava TaxID=659595 RepID=A0A7W8D3D4_9GAMM|nr:stringent starvation protein B [Chiayiivirga flava]
MSGKTGAMTSNRPYLIRAVHEWISDNGMTPYLLVDASVPGVHVPPSAVKDGRVVLNVAARAVTQLELGNAMIHFMARFSGVSQSIDIPVAAVQAIYAQETGQGMMMPADAGATAAEQPAVSPEPEAPKKPSHLRVIK